MNAAMTIDADADGLRVVAPYGAGSYLWSVFRRIRERGGFFFLDMLTGTNLLVPVDAFDEENLVNFRRLLLEAGFSPDGKLIDTAGRPTPRA